MYTLMPLLRRGRLARWPCWNGAPFSLAARHVAIAGAKPIRLTLRQDGELVQAELNYRDGERFPNLAPIETGVRLLDLITVGSTAGR